MNEGTKNYTSGNKNELHTKNSRNKNLVIFFSNKRNKYL
jgi:hypothetical protein